MNTTVPEIACRFLGTSDLSSEQIRSGNSRVFRVRSRDLSVIVKSYPAGPPDERDRMECEVAAIGFMRDHGIACVPDILDVDPAVRSVVFEDLGGQSPRDITDAHIDSAVAFLGQLKSLSSEPSGQDLMAAAEACLRPEHYFSRIEDRLELWCDIEITTPLHREALAFVFTELTPVFEELKARWIDSPHYTAIPAETLTLSPSDFGFHNALVDHAGSLAFVDFEYFGWDDPAKLICDIVLHPAMSLDDSQLSRFRTQSTEALDTDGTLGDRVDAVLPLMGVKWCFILLNEFRNDLLARRSDAGETASPRAVLERQLNKARAQLDQITCHPHLEATA